MKCSSGTRRSCSRSTSSRRINPEACSSALIASACSLFVPFTLMNTRACFISGCTRTSLATTVTSSRGSFSSPASMALISCAISSATRSWRWFVELISVLLPHFLDDLHCLIDQERAEDAVRLAQYFLQHFVHVL